MSRKANPTIIGLFVVLALALGVGGVMLFTSSKMFASKKQYILYFDASLTGLEKGTAVKYRGVTVGSVKSILIHFNQSPDDSSLPVIIELNEDLLQERSHHAFNLADDTQLEASVERGLRGKLEAQSFLTGLLYVQLEFLPKAPPPTYHQLKPVYKEIPTAPSEIQLLRVDFGEITQKLNALLSKLDASINEIHTREINHGLTNLLASIHSVAGSQELTNTLASARETFGEFRLLSTKLRARLDGLADGADHTLAESRKTMDEFRAGVQDLRDVLAPGAPLRQDVESTLEQLARAARSVSELAEFLSRYPNAVLSGRKPAETKP